MKPIEQKNAEDAKVEAGKKFHKGSNKGGGNFPQPLKEQKKEVKKTRDKVAKAAGVSGRTLEFGRRG